MSMVLLRQLSDSRNTIAAQTRAILERARDQINVCFFPPSESPPKK